MNDTRTVEAIQSDIIYLLNEKKGFFERMFHSTEKRLEELRKEEWNALSRWLYTADDTYKKRSDANIGLLADTHWQLKIIDCRNSGRSASHTSSITGIIHAKGFIHGEGSTSYLIYSEKILYPDNYIDALGNLYMRDIESWLQTSVIPKTFRCYTAKYGIIKIETVDQDYSYFYTKAIIGNVVGDPFHGDDLKRKSFLENRQWLMKTIRQHMVKQKTL
jgi:hypothetical protein